MSAGGAAHRGGPRSKGSNTVDMKIELVPLPVADVDRAKRFYVDKVGFREDVDVEPAEGVRVVQLTPPGSACSISLSTGLPHISSMVPGTVHGVHLVVADITKARAELAQQGVDLSDIEDVGGGVKYAWFSDPDGNTLTLQEMAWRTGSAF
jgi:catechol 2,3-dioxygenase-like lactoylglutathione lyase family enzyme